MLLSFGGYGVGGIEGGELEGWRGCREVERWNFGFRVCIFSNGEFRKGIE